MNRSVRTTSVHGIAVRSAVVALTCLCTLPLLGAAPASAAKPKTPSAAASSAVKASAGGVATLRSPRSTVPLGRKMK